MAFRTFVTLSAALTLVAAHAGAQPPPFPEPEAKVLLLGTFHFKDAGLDSYKPQFDIDIQSPERQAELAAVIEALARFEPTRIAVEVKPERQAVIDQRYQAYGRGEFELTSNEIYQLGFRLAKKLGHERVYAVDAEARYYDDWIDADKWARDNDQAKRLDPIWDMRYEGLYRKGDKQKTEQTLTETFLQMNTEERLLQGHGHYLVGAFEVGDPNGGANEHYPGADSTTGWYNRNLRIFANLQRLLENKDERILVIIGAGHVPILRHAVQASPQFELVEVAEVLAER